MESFEPALKILQEREAVKAMDSVADAQHLVHDYCKQKSRCLQRTLV